MSAFILSFQVAAQTAYGIEADVEGYESAYSPDLITFMDFRRHHSGVWNSAAQQLIVSVIREPSLGENDCRFTINQSHQYQSL